jgi:ABC-type polysaccharide/polyol phosphate export permease
MIKTIEVIIGLYLLLFCICFMFAISMCFCNRNKVCNDKLKVYDYVVPVRQVACFLTKEVR